VSNQLNNDFSMPILAIGARVTTFCDDCDARKSN